MLDQYFIPEFVFQPWLIFVCISIADANKSNATELQVQSFKRGRAYQYSLKIAFLKRWAQKQVSVLSGSDMESIPHRAGSNQSGTLGKIRLWWNVV